MSRTLSAEPSASSSQTAEFGDQVVGTYTLGRDAKLVKNGGGDKEIKKKHGFFGGNLFSKSKKEKDKKK